MNDPNGLSFVDGVWHAYYQHNPDDDVWGPMHWRHATSTDLLTWTDQGIALAPSSKGAAFSGCIVLDHDNSAGFGAGARVAVFTLFDDPHQRQGIAYSSDGFTWSTYDGNPVLDEPSEPDFRDPSVVRVGSAWVMALAVGRKVSFYRSDNLKTWSKTGDYIPSLDVKGTIECPDLVLADGAGGSGGDNGGEPTWLLIYADDRAGDGHGGVMVTVGTFDGSTFNEIASPTPLDHGPDFYAAQTFRGLPAGRQPIVMGWMNSWRYSGVHPSAGRRGVLSLPRTLSVQLGRNGSGSDRDSGPVVVSRPVVDLDTVCPNQVGASSWGSNPNGAVVAVGERFQARLRSTTFGQQGEVVIDVDPESVVVNRSDIGIDDFALQRRHNHSGGPSSILFDHGTLEVFTADGSVLSFLTFVGAEWSVEIEGQAELLHR